MRLGMVFEVRFVEDCLEHEYQAPLARTTVTTDVRLTMLWLTHVLGSEQIKRMLEQKPVAFVVAVASTYIARHAWMADNAVNTRVFLHAFFTCMSTIHEHFYNPQFVQWSVEGRKEANDLVVERVIDEIKSTSLTPSQQRVLIDRTPATVDSFIGAALYGP
jgi:hypothetical protein